jgi:hypothetical protein
MRACICVKSERDRNKRGGAKPSARLSDLRWVRAWG